MSASRLASDESSHASALVIPVGDIVHQPGAVRELVCDADVDDIGITLARVDSSVHVDVRLEGVLEGVVVVGSVSADAEVSCRRCLETGQRRIDASVTELFTDDAELLDDEHAEVYPVDGLEIDLEQLVRDSLTLELPESPLLCPGDPADCPNAARLRESGHLSSPGETRDPRWAVLGELFPDATEET